MIYILILAVFLGVVFFIQKAQKQSYSAMGTAAQAADPMKTVATALGLQYESFSLGTNANTLYSSGSRITGMYNGVPIEMIYALSTQSESALSGYVASSSMQKTITFHINNDTHKQFDIVPKTMNGEGGTPTGNDAFDQQFRFMGNTTLPSQFLSYCAEIGFMHLSLKENTLTFFDSFYEQFKGASGSLHMMTAAHPIWKSTPQNFSVDMVSTKKFFDAMSELAKTL